MQRATLTAMCFALFLVAGCSQGEKKLKIGYVQITEDVVLTAAKNGVFKALSEAGFIAGQNVQVIDNNAQGDLSLIPTILQSFQSQQVDLIITNSTPCMVAAAQAISDIPVVFTVAFSPEQLGMKATPPNLYGVYDPLDAKSFVSMMVECVPSLKRVALPYNNAEPNAEYAAKVFSKEFEARGIQVIKATVNSVNDLTMVGQSLVAQNVDAMMAAGDNTVYMGLNALARVASDAKLPLFVTDPHQAKKGAAIGMGVNYERWGYLSGLKAVEILQGHGVQNRIEPITDTEITINPEACKAQGLVVPKSLQEKASPISQ